MSDIGGTRVFIYNLTDETIKDLYMIYPMTGKDYKVGKIKKNDKKMVQVFGAKLEDLEFYFKRNNEHITVKNIQDYMKISKGLMLVNNSGIMLKIVKNSEGLTICGFAEWEDLSSGF